MRVLPFKIPKPTDDVLIFQEDIEKSFYGKLHQHEEIQLSYIHKGSGTLIVGDTVNSYKAGDVICIGSHLPHVFKSDKNTAENSHMISLFFTNTSFGEGFFSLNEFRVLRSFFSRLNYGFKISNPTHPFQALFLKLKHSSKLERFILLLEILKFASIKKYDPLSSFIYQKNFNPADGERLQIVYDYSMTHFKEGISLEEIATIANMTKNAFCKYFKKRTNKTYVSFLNDLKIEYSCNLLRENKDVSVTDVAYESGFNNMANYNRQFKTKKGTTPTKYRQLL